MGCFFTQVNSFSCYLEFFWFCEILAVLQRTALSDAKGVDVGGVAGGRTLEERKLCSN